MDPGAGAVPGGSRLAVVGDVAVDYYLEVAAGSGDEKATAVRSLRTLGGTGANAAVAAARLGSRVELYSAVGDDPYGPWLREQLTARGVDTSGVRTLPGHSTHATILLRDGSRQVIVDRGVGDRLGDVVPDTLAAATIYVSYAPAAVVALAAAEYGDRTVVGLEAWMVTEHGLREALPAVRLVVTNAAGWQALSQVGAPVGVPVVETRGGDGSVLHEP
ncbi:MAG: carbohydrate kinase family protein, partial [Micromonosporaceae bacterium]